MDLATGYDFNLESDRQRCWRHVEREKPYFYLLVGSPECKAFSQMQNLCINRDHDAYLLRLHEGIKH